MDLAVGLRDPRSRHFLFKFRRRYAAFVREQGPKVLIARSIRMQAMSSVRVSGRRTTIV